MALNFCFGTDSWRPFEAPRPDADTSPSIAAAVAASPPPRRDAVPRPPWGPPGPPRAPPIVRARYMHIGRIMSGTDGVMMKTCDTLDGSRDGVPDSACSLAAFGRNGSGSTPATLSQFELKMYNKINNKLVSQSVTIIINQSNASDYSDYSLVTSTLLSYVYTLTS